MRSNPIRVFLGAADRYGDLVHLKVGPYHGYLLSRPDDNRPHPPSMASRRRTRRADRSRGGNDGSQFAMVEASLILAMIAQYSAARAAIMSWCQPGPSHRKRRHGLSDDYGSRPP
jgi:hypothetical protein